MNRGGAPRPGRRAGLLLAAASLLFALGLAEVVLRRIGSRGPDGPALPDYGAAVASRELGPAGYLVPGFDAWLTDGTGGRIHWRNDARGFRTDRAIAATPAPEIVRLLFVGDSFVAGYRVDQADVFPLRLERRWGELANRPTIEALIAEVEDPVTARDYLGRFGPELVPRLVLVGLTLGNDLDQVYFRQLVGDAPAPAEGRPVDRLRSILLPAECHSPDRARGEGRTVAGRSRLVDLVRSVFASRNDGHGEAVLPYFGDWREPRLFDGNGLGLCLREPPPEIEEALRATGAVLAETKRELERQGVGMLLLLFPQRYEIQERDWVATVAAYGLDERCFDRSAARRRIAGLARELEIDTFDPTPDLAASFAASGRSLYLPAGDMHWNAHGHAVVAEALGRYLEERFRGRTSGAD